MLSRWPWLSTLALGVGGAGIRDSGLREADVGLQQATDGTAHGVALGLADRTTDAQAALAGGLNCARGPHRRPALVSRHEARE